ncbi:hypothetical protein E4633_00020 [Geomonas terrae]|uniref:Nuclear transport factor 2 family protein n=1 Tax=Geomonas terrae TaxID=2562681 RepID=A0A4S1CJP8_9BACT|nr:hypothetical protein [Geomonas terrae]TGU73897.1 hypothetical protein E4633_00020 [Geomonas terrae]
MLRRVAAIGLLFLLATTGIAVADSDVQSFWNTFREAALRGDSARVAAMTKLPLWVRGPDDSDQVVHYGRKDFDKILKKLLNQEVLVVKDEKVLTTNMLKIINDKRSITARDLKTPDLFSVELFTFEKKNGNWLFTRGYLEDAPP